MYEKKISPKKNVAEIKKENNKLTLKNKIKIKREIKNEIKVPEIVFFGLIVGVIRGPLIIFPNIKALVSFMKLKIIIE